MSKLSQAIAEGDGISILVEVDDSASAEKAERQGADGLVARRGPGANAVRVSSQLPLLYVGGLADASGLAADAVVVAVDRASWDEGRSLGLECVVRVSQAGELEHALDELDPEVFLLTAEPDEEDDPLDVLLGLLHDVPAGKLAIAELHEATPADVAELERAGVDAVLVAPDDVPMLVGTEPPAV